jgi:uncharacterized repeat protein (TIGR04076 family)
VVDLAKVKVTVKTPCKWEYHKKGDTWELGDYMFKTGLKGMCVGMVYSMLPYLMGLVYGAKYSWSEDKDVEMIHCMEPGGMNVELRRGKDGKAPGCNPRPSSEGS